MVEILAPIALIAFLIWVLKADEDARKPKLPKYDGTTPTCPRCGKSHYHTVLSTEVILPGKTKTKTSLNMNPLKPFTVLNHKEKVVRKEVSREVVRYMCDECGNIWG